MHLHDALRLWRSEIVSSTPRVAMAADDLRGVDKSVLAGLAREALPGGLRRDDKNGLQAVVAPAEHRPGRPAEGDALDALEARLGLELPRGVELLLSLHDGGEFFAATTPGLPASLSAPIQLLSCAEMAEAYDVLIRRMKSVLEQQDPDEGGLFRLGRRFGASPENARALADQLRGLRGGADRGLEIVPLARLAGRDDMITLVPRAGKAGRVGHSYAVSGYLPEHSDEFAFEGLEGWLEALVRGKGCHRVAT